MKTEFISVIMPSFNSEKYIGEAIASVLAQTHKALELIVVDNGSTDQTLSIIQACKDKRLRYFTFKNDGVIARSRNFAAKQASGALFAFIDSDDVWHEKKLEEQLKYLTEDVSLISTDFSPMGFDRYYGHNISIEKRLIFKDFDFPSLLKRNWIMTSSVLLRKKAFDAVGGFDEASELAFIEDWDLWLRIVHKFGSFRLLNQRLIGYRIYENKNRNRLEVAKNLMFICTKLSKRQMLTPLQRRRMVGFCHYSMGVICIDISNKMGTAYLWIALKNANWHLKLKTLVCLFSSLFPNKEAAFFINNLRRLRRQFIK